MAFGVDTSEGGCGVSSTVDGGETFDWSVTMERTFSSAPVWVREELVSPT